MERPNTVLGLTAHVARDRWQRLSTGGRVLIVVGAALVSLVGLVGVRMAVGGACCASECPMAAAQAARIEAEPTATAHAAPASTASPCSHSN